MPICRASSSHKSKLNGPSLKTPFRKSNLKHVEFRSNSTKEATGLQRMGMALHCSRRPPIIIIDVSKTYNASAGFRYECEKEEYSEAVVNSITGMLRESKGRPSFRGSYVHV
jgi:hypothetical protein